MEVPKHVLLFTYKAEKKPGQGKYERYDALVIGSNTVEGHGQLTLNLVYFDATDAHHALNGINWADTLHRTLFVPHKDDVDKQSFYWIAPHEENVRPDHEPADDLPSADDLDVAVDEQETAAKTSAHKPKKIAFGKS